MTGRGAAWLARLLWEQEVEGSNPFAPTRVTTTKIVSAVNIESWIDCVQNFGRWFHRAAGGVKRTRRLASANNGGRAWLGAARRWLKRSTVARPLALARLTIVSRHFLMRIEESASAVRAASEVLIRRQFARRIPPPNRNMK